MRVALHRGYGKHVNSEIEIYKTILEYNDIHVQYVDVNDSTFWDDLAAADAFVFKWGHWHDHHLIAHTVLPIIEFEKKYRLFPNFTTYWHYDDKVKQDIMLKQAGFPFVESYIFWDKDLALKWTEQTEYPLVFKLSKGAGSRSVFLVHSAVEARSLVKSMFGRGYPQDKLSISQIYSTRNRSVLGSIKEVMKILHSRLYGNSPFWQKNKNYIYFQKFCPGNEWDTRVTTAGLRAHAFRRFNRENDFRASGSNKWDITPANIDLKMVRIALDISKHFGFQAMAYDFVYDECRVPKIVEISYCYGGAGYPDFMNGYWDYDLIWHEGRFWPQYFEMVDLLDKTDLLCPEIETKTSYKKARLV